ncbi:C45 family autoproteolytic acyltransferase/hydolase [Aliirhizobium smilacinae]|nr:C45 family peptidase [Rhizobium smilacinae]
MSSLLSYVGYNLPIVMLSGSAFQRGHQHGKAFSERIARLIGQMRQSHSPAGYDQARVLASESWAGLQTNAPTIAEEICGIAAGSNSDPLELYCHIGFEFFEKETRTGCSGLALATRDGAILGQNWDCHPDLIDDLALFLHVEEAGWSLAVIATVGTLGWVGQNSSGLALLSMDTMLDCVERGIPSQVARRLMLGEPDIQSALTHLEDRPIMAGRSYLLGDRSGSIAAVEVSPSAGVCRLPNAGRYFHTNHALTSQTQAVEDEQRLNLTYPSSRMRLASLQCAGADAQSVDDLKRILSNRENAPHSVAKTSSGLEPTMTAFSIVFDCGERDFYLCSGPPAPDRYQRFYWPETKRADTPAFSPEPNGQPIGVEI